jgi:hypothetical protein
VPAQPWYRHFWVWVLFVPPVAAMVFWTVIITVFAGPPSLVVDDYAKIGLAYQQERDRDAAAAELGVSARLHLLRESGGVTVVLRGPGRTPERLRFRLTHPAEATRDLGIRLDRTASGIYRGDLDGPAGGRWRVELTPPDGRWRLAGEIFAGESDLELHPPEQVAER